MSLWSGDPYCARCYRVQVTHADGSRVGALHGWSVEAGEEGPVGDRVAQGEDQRLGLTASQGRIQPPRLGHKVYTHFI